MKKNMAESTNNKIKIVFMGTSEFSVPVLKALNENCEVLAVVCEKDNIAGRGQKLQFCPVKKFAIENQLPFFQPEHLRNNKIFYQQLKNLNPDIIVVLAYGKILPMEILNLPLNGCLNIHPSLLPKYRGPSPIQSALLNGDKTTGVSIILMDAGMDTGDIVYSESVDIEEKDNFFSLSDKLCQLSSEIIVKILLDYTKNELPLVIQEEAMATYCQKINKTDGEINWQKSASMIVNQIKAYIEWPGSYTFFNNKKIDLLEAEEFFDPELVNFKKGQMLFWRGNLIICCGDGFLRVNKLKIEGKNSVSSMDFMNGYSQFDNVLLGRY